MPETQRNHDQLLLQYELSTKNVEFLDIYIPRTLALYIALYIALISTFSNLGDTSLITDLMKQKSLMYVRSMISIAIILLSTIPICLIIRIHQLQSEQIKNIRKIEAIWNKNNGISSIPSIWGNKLSTVHISVIGIISVCILSIFSINLYLTLLFLKLNLPISWLHKYPLRSIQLT